MRRRGPKQWDFKCDKCGMELPRGDGGALYVEDYDGKRIPCPQGHEAEVVREILGANTDWNTVKERMGRNSHCICLDCARQFDADYGFEGYKLTGRENGFQRFWAEFSKGITPDKDVRRCPKCGSPNVRTTREIANQTCPKCKEGTISVVELEEKPKKK